MLLRPKAQQQWRTTIRVGNIPCAISNILATLPTVLNNFNLKGPNMKILPLMLFFILTLSIPVWIKAVSIRRLQLSTKKILISAMVLYSMGFSIYALLRVDYENSTDLSIWVGNASIIVWSIFVLAAANFSWPRDIP